MDINDLRRKRKEAAEAMKAKAEAIAALEGVDGTTEDMLTAAQSEFDSAKLAFDRADGAVKRAETVENALSLSAVSEAGTDPAVAPVTVPAQAVNADAKGADLGLMVAALANSKGDKERAATQLEASGHTQIAATLSGAVDSAGGILIPRPQSEVLIGLLKPKVVVRKLGAVSHDMPAGKLRKGRVASAPTAGYIGENAPIVESEPTFDKVDEDFKTLTALVPIGNALLAHSSVSIGMMVRDLLLDYMALREDLAFLRGDGLGNTPKGLLNWCLAGHKQTGIANTPAVVEAALRKMVSTVEDADIPMIRPGWAMRGATKHFLASLREPSSGQKIYPSIEASGTLHGFPIETTSQIPNNLGAGSDTEITFADFSEIMIGDDQEIRIASSTEASFVDTNGDTISAFQRDLTLMRAVSRHDLAPAHDEAIAVTTGTAWGL